MNNYAIQQRFQSVVYLSLHFLCSLGEFVGLLSILALQITLTGTETCAYRLLVGFWSFPFLCLAPLSLCFLLLRRDGLACVVALLSHFLSTLFCTAVVLVTFLVLLQSLGTSSSSSCSTSNGLFLPLNPVRARRRRRPESRSRGGDASPLATAPAGRFDPRSSLTVEKLCFALPLSFSDEISTRRRRKNFTRSTDQSVWEVRSLSRQATTGS